MVKIWRKLVLFYLGGMAYVGLELLWRGRSHGSMFAAGGLSFILIGHLPRISLPLRAVSGAAIITAVELVTGLIANRDYTVWDYRGQPGNFKGQICPLFTLIWIPISLLAFWLYGVLDTAIANKKWKAE